MIHCAEHVMPLCLNGFVFFHAVISMFVFLFKLESRTSKGEQKRKKVDTSFLDNPLSKTYASNLSYKP